MVAFTAQIALSSAFSTQELHDMSIKSMMDAPYLTHRKVKTEQKGQRSLQQGGGYISKYSQLAYNSEFPELDMLEDFLLGFLTGSTFAGSPQCRGAMTGMIF